MSKIYHPKYDPLENPLLGTESFTKRSKARIRPRKPPIALQNAPTLSNNGKILPFPCMQAKDEFNKKYSKKNCKKFRLFRFHGDILYIETDKNSFVEWQKLVTLYNAIKKRYQQKTDNSTSNGIILMNKGNLDDAKIQESSPGGSTLEVKTNYVDSWD